MPALRLLIAAAMALLVVPSSGANAEDNPVVPAPKTPPGCIAPEHRQFDFWLGDWVVRDPSGKVVGENHLTSLHKGCALFENWTGGGGFTGSSLNLYDAERRQWHQTWVDISGGLLLLDGAFVDGKMVLAGKSAPDAQGVIALQRITWTPLPDGRVRQLWETSSDGAKTWTTVFDGYYSKAK
ncbi:MAG: hypothetical protein ABJC33_03270 [Betaproteobacteria bacterium]